MKEEIKYKMGLLDERKEEKKRLTLELSTRKTNSLIGSRKIQPQTEANSVYLREKSLR